MGHLGFLIVMVLQLFTKCELVVVNCYSYMVVVHLRLYCDGDGVVCCCLLIVLIALVLQVPAL